jgi:hypothetical protein
VQQLPLEEHESPGCPQNDEAWHVPVFAQSPEQHWALAVHWLPTVLQVALRAAHVPLAQFWLQHWPLELHGCVSDVHAG